MSRWAVVLAFVFSLAIAGLAQSKPKAQPKPQREREEGEAEVAGKHNLTPEQARARQKLEEKLKKELIAKETSLIEAEKKKDLRYIFLHLSDDFTEFSGDGGVYHKSDIAPNFQYVDLKDYKLSDWTFMMLNEQTCLVAYRLDVDFAFKGQPGPKHMLVTTVWTKNPNLRSKNARVGDVTDPEWVARTHQATVIPESEKK